MKRSFDRDRNVTLILPVLTKKGHKENQRRTATEHIGNRGGPDNAIGGDPIVKEKHKGNIENTFAHQSQGKRLSTLAGSLKERDHCVGTSRKRSAQAKDAEESGPGSGCLGTGVDENGDE